MVKKSTVEKWELPEINVDVNDDGDVISISCKICKEYYEDDDEGREELKKFTGKVRVGCKMDKRITYNQEKQCTRAHSKG